MPNMNVLPSGLVKFVYNFFQSQTLYTSSMKPSLYRISKPIVHGVDAGHLKKENATI